MAEVSQGRRRILVAAAGLLLVAVAGYAGWQRLNGTGLPAGFASGNGRIEAVAIDISAKVAGRLSDRIGRRPVLWLGSAAAVVLSVPAFLLRPVNRAS